MMVKSVAYMRDPLPIGVVTPTRIYSLSPDSAHDAKHSPPRVRVTTGVVHTRRELRMRGDSSFYASSVVSSSSAPSNSNSLSKI